MTKSVVKFQIGKNGVTSGVIDSILSLLKNYKHVRINVLKSSGRNKENITEMAVELKSKIEQKSDYIIDYKIIGFTIILRRRILKE